MPIYVNGDAVSPIIVEVSNKLTQVLNKTVTTLTAEDLEGVTQIPKYAFDNCKSLVSVVLPDTITSIGDHAFYFCDNLQNINIPINVTSIGTAAFYFCTKLEGDLDLSNNTNLEIIEGASFEYCPFVNIFLPASILEIGNLAFAYNDDLTTLNFAGTLQQFIAIDKDARWNYSNSCRFIINQEELINLTIPENITELTYACFSGCSSLLSVIIPNTVNNISTLVFDNCQNLTTMRIEATTPPTLGNISAISTATTQIQVPMASVDAYKTATNWSNFADIIVGYTE